MNRLLLILLLLPVFLTGQVNYSTQKTLYYVRIVTGHGAVPDVNKFKYTNDVIYNSTDSVGYIKRNGVVTLAYTIYPYSVGAIRLVPTVVKTSTATVPTVRSQYYVKTSLIPGNYPPLNNYTSSIVRCWNVDSTLWQKWNGANKKQYICYTFSPRVDPEPPTPPSFPTLVTRVYVSTSGSDSYTLSQAHNPLTPVKTLYRATSIAVSGDTIFVAAGTYLETQQCNLAVGVSIVGEGIASVINSTFSTAAYSQSSIQLESSDGTDGNQSISYLKIGGSNLTAASAISVFGRSNVKIHNITISDFYERGIYVTANSGYQTGNEIYNCTITNSSIRDGSRGGGLIRIGRQDGLLIHNNILTQTSRATGQNGNTIDGVDGYNKNLKIYNNTSTKNDDEGASWNFHFELWNGKGGNEIYNNTFLGGSAIDIGGQSDVKGSSAYSTWIHDNDISLRTQFATYTAYFKVGISIEAASSDEIISDNHFKNLPFGVAFSISAGSLTQDRNTVRNNLFESMGWADSHYSSKVIWITGEDATASTFQNFNIYNNTIVGGVGQAGTGIHLNSKTSINNINIVNNIFKNIGSNGDGFLAFYDGAGVFNTIELLNNNIYNCGNSNTVYYRNGKTVTNLVKSGGISTNPLFVSSTDFNLQSGSPCINAGVNVGLPYLGTAPDLGSYEKQ